MPTNRRRRLRRRTPTLTTETILADRNLMLHLLHGGRCGHPKFNRFETLEEFTTAWALIRDVALPKFIEEHPGHRPFAWYVERQLQRPVYHENLPTGVTEEHLRRENERWRNCPQFGLIHCGRIYPKDHQEPEAEFLERLGLLEFGELDRYEAVEAEKGSARRRGVGGSITLRQKTAL